MLPVFLTILLGVLAYQMPVQTQIDIGQLGDQLFVPSSEAQRAAQIESGAWYADQLDQDGRGRYRWSRERATIALPGLGSRRDIRLTLNLAGWPADIKRDQPKQPQVEVRVGDQVIGQFTPTPDVRAYTIDVPAQLHETPTLSTLLQITPTFTDTATATDARPKGIRLDAIGIDARGWGTLPDWRVLLGLVFATTLSMGVARNRSRRSWLIVLVGVGVALCGATLIIVARLWLAALLPAIVVLLAGLLVALNWRVLLRVARGVRWRLHESSAFNAGLPAALLVLCVYLLARILVTSLSPDAITIADNTDRWFTILMALSLISGVGLAITASLTVLPRWVLHLRRALLTTRLPAITLGLAAGLWIGYETWLIWNIPVVGHADYADNAVVARNLLRGRGWIVDYVTQFYQLLPGGSVTRVQETWPLLQPLIIAPFMALLGPTPFAARLPNILFLIALTVLIYHIGSRIWDRRVGLIGALLTLGNLLFFRLAFYATSDLALVIWSMAAFWQVYQAVTGDQPAPAVQSARRTFMARLRWLSARHWELAGLFTGLMILQKPSAAIFAVGMGLWVLAVLERRRRARGLSLRQALPWLRPVIVWTALTVLVVSPYLARNLHEFGRLFFSTEAWDAWILYFRGTGDDAWDDIYKIYAPEFYRQFVPGQTGPGLPDRSWILRWGYDLTINKIVQQAVDAWTFFVPPRGKLLNYDMDGVTLTWLMLLGILTLRPRQRRIIGLVASALALYTTFLILYWHTHYEERYFVPFVPWLALLAAWGACRLFDRIAVIGRGRWAGLAGLTLSLALIVGMRPHYREINAELDPQNRSYWGVEWEAELAAMEWIEQNTPRDTVIMTRIPWQVNFYADRPTLMIPNANLDQILQIARYYGADYVMVNALTTSQAERTALKPLVEGLGLPGWTCVYAQPDRYNGRPVLIYRMPKDAVSSARGSDTQAETSNLEPSTCNVEPNS